MVIKFPKPPRSQGIDYVMLARDGSKIMALIGPNLQEGIGGFGDTIPHALRDLADAMEKEGWRSSSVF
jgi:hypothetical protein